MDRAAPEYKQFGAPPKGHEEKTFTERTQKPGKETCDWLKQSNRTYVDHSGGKSTHRG